jgi:hypothetical protein
MNQNFSFLQDRDINKLPDFTRFDASNNSSNMGSGTQSNKTGGHTESAYDKLLKSRGEEMQKRAPMQQPNFSSPY